MINCTLYLAGLLLSAGVLTDVRHPLKETLCRQAFTGKAASYELTYYGKPYGFSIWMEAGVNNSKLQAGYLGHREAHANLYERYADWSAGKRIVLSSTVSFASGSYEHPIGLCFDLGTPVNNQWGRNMDALVVINKGDLSVYDGAAGFYFPPLQDELVLTDPSDKVRFTAWAQKNRASVFQTHLLVEENEMKINRTTQGRKAYRKFLGLLSDHEGRTYRAVFYIRFPETLFAATRKIYDYLNEKGVSIRSLVNLDTGANDILEVDSTMQTCRAGRIEGEQGLASASNLLSFFYR